MLSALRFFELRSLDLEYHGGEKYRRRAEEYPGCCTRERVHSWYKNIKVKHVRILDTSKNLNYSENLKNSIDVNSLYTKYLNNSKNSK